MRRVPGEPGARPLVGEMPLSKRAGRGERRAQRRSQPARAQPVAQRSTVRGETG
jgi:hypothetical protein